MTVPPPAALSVSPARLELAGSAGRAIRVVNPGRAAALVDAGPSGFALDLRGQPRIVVRRDPAVRLAVRPRRLALKPGAAAAVVVSSTVGPHARPGDHAALVVLTTRARRHGGVAVRMRLGIVVVVRVPGAVVHRLELRRLRAAGGRTLEVVLRNGGNVVERLAPPTLRVRLRRRGRTVATIPATSREILPGTRGVVSFRCPARLHGLFRAIVELADGHGHASRRVLRLRLP